jgi:glycolate oxidase
MITNFVSNQEIILAARRNLTQDVWDYLSGGSESETTLRRNRLELDSLAFRPRVLIDVSKVDTSTTVLGHQLRIPVMLAPIGSLQLLDDEGAVAASKAAAEFGTINFVSSVAQPALEETAASTESPKIFQLYVRGDHGWIEDTLERAKQAGFKALCLTVDTARYGNRERQAMNRWLPPNKRKEQQRIYQRMLTWETMDFIKKVWGLPFILKGVATAEDAAMALDHGVDVIYVSNHGGRQLDHGKATIEILPEIVDTVAGKAEILIDSGFLRGSDIAKAIALGAKAVAIGKLQGWALAAGGIAGLVRALELLEAELITTMGLLGVTRVDQICSAHVCKVQPTTPPHEMSTFVNMPGGQIL